MSTPLTKAGSIMNTSTTPTTTGRRTFRASAAFAKPAAAVSTTPGDFSSLLRGNPNNYVVDDCRVELGFVVDSTPYPNYAKVGGVRVNCNTVHSWIDATVALYYWNGTGWVQYGSSGYGIRYNQRGSGLGLSGILHTPRYCAGAASRGLYWKVGTTVRTNRARGTTYGNVYQDNSGC
jgi:hypothetical protein